MRFGSGARDPSGSWAPPWATHCPHIIPPTLRVRASDTCYAAAVAAFSCYSASACLSPGSCRNSCASTPPCWNHFPPTRSTTLVHVSREAWVCPMSAAAKECSAWICLPAAFDLQAELARLQCHVEHPESVTLPETIRPWPWQHESAVASTSHTCFCVVACSEVPTTGAHSCASTSALVQETRRRAYAS